MSLKIFVVTHKNYWFPNNKVYVPIMVGVEKENSTIKYRDDNGFNIAYKNNIYCELTVYYWIWKNNISDDVIGIVHYRRYFNFLDKNLYSIKRNIGIKNNDIIEKYIDIDEVKIKKYLNRYDMILPKTCYFKKKIRKYYNVMHNKEDLDIIEHILIKSYPEYVKAFKKVMNRKYMYCYNMFIMKRFLFNDYCDWLFSILSEAEKYIRVSDDPYQARVMGFLSERLLNVYIEYNNLKIKEFPIVYIDEKNIFLNKIEYLGPRGCCYEFIKNKIKRR